MWFGSFFFDSVRRFGGSLFCFGFSLIHNMPTIFHLRDGREMEEGEEGERGGRGEETEDEGGRGLKSEVTRKICLNVAQC